MSDTPQPLEVLLHGQHVGRIEWRGSNSRFRFSDEYVESDDRLVLGLSFEEDLRSATYGHDRLPTWFTNLLPEGQLRRLVAAELGLPLGSRQTLVDEVKMASAIGHDMVGAAQLLPTSDTGEAWEPPAAMDVDTAASDGLLRFSLAGMGLKFSMIEDGQRFTAPAYGDAGDWIVKLPDQVFASVPQNEFTMMNLARRVGINVPPVRLVHRDEVEPLPDRLWSGESYAYAVERFDRGEGRAPIHVEDLAQVRSFVPDNRYAGTFETVARLFYRGRDLESLTEFTRRLAFNMVIGNSDAHLKNWSLIYPDGRVPRISPAYDLVSVVVYRRPGLAHDLGLKFAGHKKYEDLRFSYFDRLERKLGLSGVGLREIAESIVEAVVAQLDSVLDDLPEAHRLGLRAHVQAMPDVLAKPNHPNY